MKIALEDVDLFYKLMYGLQFFAKERLNLFPEIKTLEDYAACSSEVKVEIREQLFEKRTLIDAFVTANPQRFSADELQIIQSWHNAVFGQFYLERMLKRHAIFIATSDNTVYGVLGLYDDFDEIVHKSRLPMIFKTLLLPFKGQIIFDGLMEGYNMRFGGGIRGNLKEIYLSAKQNGRIIESLDNSASSAGKKVAEPQKNWSPQMKKLATAAKKLRSGSGEPAINKPTFKLINASIELGQVAAANPHDSDQLWDALKKVERSLLAIEKTIYRMD